jgi:hypothetical protein
MGISPIGPPGSADNPLPLIVSLETLKAELDFIEAEIRSGLDREAFPYPNAHTIDIAETIRTWRGSTALVAKALRELSQRVAALDGRPAPFPFGGPPLPWEE